MFLADLPLSIDDSFKKKSSGRKENTLKLKKTK
jgi:hypothetical protein